MSGRTRIINELIKNNGYSTYLEIGVGDKVHLHGVSVPLINKVGIDPNRNTTYRMSSDEAFKQHLPKDQKFDVIFIDGMHLKDFVLRDIKNSLDHLSPGGTIVCHDCNPPTEINASPVPMLKGWYGTAWEAIAHLRMTREDLFITVVDMDCGCAIIRPGEQILSSEAEINYKLLEDNRKEILNLISFDKFCELKL